MKYIIFYFNTDVTKVFNRTRDKDGNNHIEISSVDNIVYNDEILLKVVDIADPEEIKNHLDDGYDYHRVLPYFKFKIGEGIYFDESNHSYVSQEYGFVILDNKKTIRLVPPLLLNRSKTRAHIFIYPSKSDKLPSYDDINEIYNENKIMYGFKPEIIEEKLAKIDSSKKVTSKFLIAKSKDPVHGRKEYFLPIIDINKKAGKVKSDGSIDFREVDAIIQVSKGDGILKQYHEIVPENGIDIYGEKIPAKMEPVKGFQRGENIVQGGGEDRSRYVSTIDGCLSCYRKTISVKPQAVIKGDIDYESGNIDFNGTVIVKGSVLPGFKVHAKGDIIIENSVDDAELSAVGNITVKMGISGKGSARVKANGYIRAKFLLNSKIQAGGSIEVEDSIINCSIFSNDTIFVTSEHGTIMGGNVIARHIIDVNYIGSAKETPTEVTVGRNLEVEKELQAIRNEISENKKKTEDIMGDLKNCFGSYLFINPREFISKLPEVKRTKCQNLLQQVSLYKKELEELSAKVMKVEEKMVFDHPPKIIVHKKIHRGATLTIKKVVKKIIDEIQNAVFYEDTENKLIRFTPATESFE